jgi:hypothetical protein
MATLTGIWENPTYIPDILAGLGVTEEFKPSDETPIIPPKALLGK